MNTTNTTTMKNGPAPRPLAAGRALLWVATSTLGASVGIAVARPVAELVREPLGQLLGGLPTIALFGAIFGACVGLGHALVRWRPSGLHPAWWVLASTVSGAVGYLLGAKLATILTDPIRGKVLVYFSEVLGYLVLGAVLGLLFGVVRAGLGSALWGTGGQGSSMGIVAVVAWIARSMLGWGLGFVVAAGVGLLITSLPSVTVRDLLFGGLIGLTAGSLEALAKARQSAV